VLNVAKHFNSSLTGSVVIKMPKTGTMGNTYCDLTFDPTARFSPITESVVTSVDATVVLSTIAHTITDSTTVSIVDQAAPTVAHCNYTDVEIPYIPSPSSINWPSSITFQYYVPVPTNDQYFDFPGTQTPAVDVAATLQATQTGSGIWEGSVVAYPPIFVSPTANIRGRWPYTSWNSQATLVWPTSPGTSYSNYFEFSQTALNGTPSAVRLWQGFLQYFTTDWGTTIGSGPATYNQTIYTSPGTEWLGIVPSGTQWYRKITYSIATDVQQKDPPYSPGEYFHKATGTITTNFYNPTDFTNMVVPVFLSSGFPSIVTLKYAPSGVYQGYTKTYRFNTATTISNTPGATYT
jgi:hypothetical protein